MDGGELTSLTDPRLLYRGSRPAARRIADELAASGIPARLIDTGNPMSEHFARGGYTVDLYVSENHLEVGRKIGESVLRESLAEHAPRVEQLRRALFRDLVVAILVTVAAGAILHASGLRNPAIGAAVYVGTPIAVLALLSGRRTRGEDRGR